MIQIENLTDRPVLLCLNSGLTRYLAPYEKTGPFLNTEIGDGVRRLEERQILGLLVSRDKPPKPKPKTAAKRGKPTIKATAKSTKKTANAGSKTEPKKK